MPVGEGAVLMIGAQRMTQRKAELPKSRLDREFPYQVAFPAARGARNADGVLVQMFCDNLKIAPHHHTVRREDKDFIIYCFADPQHAASFQARFGGEPFDPAERGRGASWWRWKKASA
jgi:hypothetical protein